MCTSVPPAGFSPHLRGQSRGVAQLSPVHGVTRWACACWRFRARSRNCGSPRLLINARAFTKSRRPPGRQIGNPRASGAGDHHHSTCGRHSDPDDDQPDAERAPWRGRVREESGIFWIPPPPRPFTRWPGGFSRWSPYRRAVLRLCHRAKEGGAGRAQPGQRVLRRARPAQRRTGGGHISRPPPPMSGRSSTAHSLASGQRTAMSSARSWVSHSMRQ